MPGIDEYAAEGEFAEKRSLVRDLARGVMLWEAAREISLFVDDNRWRAV